MIRFWYDILGKLVVVIHAETQERKEIKSNSQLMNTFLEAHEVTLQELQIVHYDNDRLGLFRDSGANGGG